MRVTSVALAALAVAAPIAAAAQAPLGGTVRDAQSGRPLDGVAVTIDQWGLAATTDSSGRYRLVVPGGEYEIEVRRIGYRPEARLLSVVVRDSIPLDVALSPQPVELPELVAVAEARNRFWAPIEERIRHGIGNYFTEDILGKSENRRFSDLPQTRVAGLSVQRRGSKSVALGRGGCPMAIWVDGLRIWAPTTLGQPTPPPDLDQWQPADLQVVEVYVGTARTPMEFQVTGSACGSLVIWTRHR